MISVRFSITDKEMSIDVEGHSGFAEYGKDLVCVSASTLLYTIAQIISEAQENDMLEEKAKILLKSGKGAVTCLPKKMYYGYIESAFAFVEVGFTLLSHNYPQYVEVKNESENNS